jgi:glycosyltransferase involved in cell wall biosynthesis
LNKPPHILIFSPSCQGGIAEYTIYQARALKRAGAEVLCLVAPSFLKGRNTGFDTLVCLTDPVVEGSSKLAKKQKMAWRIILSRFILAFQILKRRPDLVLLDSFVEYLSPFWILPHWWLAKGLGVRYAAVLHDPVRDFILGPLWWHKLSVRLAYLPLDFVLVHHTLPEPSPVPSGTRVVEVPHGLYEFGDQVQDVAAIRREWGVAEWQKVFLSFGYVRDGKNLDLAIKALVSVPQAFLVIAGSVASGKDKSFSYYRRLAEELGVAGRCRFFEGFLQQEELGRFFTGTDFVLLTYSASFHSQSGVLNLAAFARKPVLASASPSPMIESITKYHLGVAVEPDSQVAIEDGMKKLLQESSSPVWDEYEAAASWDENAMRVLRRI